jgi:hypothetical protein
MNDQPFPYGLANEPIEGNSVTIENDTNILATDHQARGREISRIRYMQILTENPFLNLIPFHAYHLFTTA